MTTDNTAPSIILLKGGRIYDEESGTMQYADMLIADGKVAEVADSIDPSRFPDTELKVADCTGQWILPGFVDLHVHLRTPGLEYKETIATGTAAAAAGGFTTVCSMPNVNPVPDSLDTLEPQLEAIRRESCIEVLPYASITRMRMGDELVDYQALAPMVAGFSDDGTGVQSAEVMRAAMEAIAPTGRPLAAHCEVESLLHGGYIHDGEYARGHGHAGICSESEWGEVKRDIELAEATGCHLHVCHISTAESVQLIREAKTRGVKVSGETGPHYLTFTDADLQEDGRFKMNPPIRSAADREALRQGIIDGTLECIATDHAPHAAAEKAKGLKGSAMGVVGLETSFAAVYTTMVLSGLMPLRRLVETMALAPRRLFGIQGGIKVGDRADIAIVDPTIIWTVEPEHFLSKGRATPYAGQTLTGHVTMTLANGKIVYEYHQ